MNKQKEQLATTAVCESERPEDLSTAPPKWEELVKELKMQWRMMWCYRIDDKVRAEGIARQDYPLLFLKRGTVVIATRKYAPPDFMEILEHHRGLHNIKGRVDYVNAVVGGWTKFVKDVLKRQPRFTSRARMLREPPKFGGKKLQMQQKKKGGRGWVHRF